MDVAIVTGADSRFGDSVIRTLLKMGFRVHALGQSPDGSAYDERYVICHSYGPGKLAELKECLDGILEDEGRLDLLVGIGGPEITTGWEESPPEALVRRLHGCLTEPLLAANICLPALRASKGFVIHGHRRPVSAELEVSPGYFEDSLRRAYDDLFVRNAAAGLRSARILYAFPDTESEGSAIHQDLADSVSRAFEIVLRQKETCVVREMHISPRGLVPASKFPNLVPGVDPYQNTVLPPGDGDEKDPILIPTEKPRHYVQIAELKDVTNGEEDPETDAAWEPETESTKSGGSKSKRPPRKRSSRKRQKPNPDRPENEGSRSESSGEAGNPAPAGTEGEGKPPTDQPAPEASEKGDNPPAKRKPRPRKRPKKRTAPPKKAKMEENEPSSDSPEKADPPKEDSTD